jgi:hypothetical protein
MNRTIITELGLRLAEVSEQFVRMKGSRPEMLRAAVSRLPDPSTRP